MDDPVSPSDRCKNEELSDGVAMQLFQRSALNIVSVKIPVAQMRFLLSCSPAKVRVSPGYASPSRKNIVSWVELIEVTAQQGEAAPHTGQRHPAKVEFGGGWNCFAVPYKHSITPQQCCAFAFFCFFLILSPRQHFLSFVREQSVIVSVV